MTRIEIEGVPPYGRQGRRNGYDDAVLVGPDGAVSAKLPTGARTVGPMG